eukprot:scaffold4266_cov139-Skeletonema_menzelii.AAC.16
MTTICPICGAGPVLDETCPATCGSLEGTLPSDVDRSSRTFGFDWGKGFVAPFLGIDHQTAKDALMAAQVSKNDSVVDLGCGDGRVCIAACLLGADGTGYDLDENLITKAKSLADEMDSSSTGKRPKFDVKDLFEVDLDQFTIICTFLLPETMDRLVPTLLVELSKGSRIISFGWQVHGLGEPLACCRGKADSTATERWFLYARQN